MLMSEELLVRHCSPTLAGMKTGSIFNCSYADDAQMRDSLRRFNRLLGKKGLRILPLRYRNHRALIYVYRPSQLSRDLRRDSARRLLKKCGYRTETPECCLVHLIKRLKTEEEFPHEIGLFLGYPPEDVDGFIENHAQDFKCSGCWKVYGDKEKAEELFAAYKECTACFLQKLNCGSTIEQLAVCQYD